MQLDLWSGSENVLFRFLTVRYMIHRGAATLDPSRVRTYFLVRLYFLPAALRQ